MILVIFYHALVWLPYAGYAKTPIEGALGAISHDMRMPLLFFTAGLFASKWAARSWKELLYGKLSFLIWPFLIWQVAILAYKFAAALWLPGREDSMNLLLPMTALSIFRPNGESWFLWALGIYFVISKAVSRLPTVWVVGSAATISVIWSSLVIPQLNERHEQLLGPGLLNVMMYFVFFIGASRHGDWILEKVSSWNLVAYSAVFVAWVALAVTLHVMEMPSFMFLDQVLAVAGGLALARLLERVGMLQRIGRSTLAIYLSHSAVVVGFAIVFAHTQWLEFPMFVTLSPYILTLIALALGYLVNNRFGKTLLFEPPAKFLSGKHFRAA